MSDKQKEIDKLLKMFEEEASHVDESRRLPFIEDLLANEPERALWHVRRLGGLGGSDVPAIIMEKLGKRSPFGTTVDLFMQKQCYALISDKQSDPELAGHFERGHVLEPYILDKFKKDHNLVDFHEGIALYDAFVANGGLKGTALRGNPDGVFIDPKTGEVTIGDAKAPMKPSGRVDDQYMIQLAVYRKLYQMAGVRVDHLRLLQLDISSMNVLPLEVRVPKKIDEMIIPAVDEFWQTYVVADKRPQFDSGKTFQKLEELPNAVQAKVETYVMINQIKNSADKRAKEAKEELETSLLSYGYNIGAADKTALGKLSYSAGSPRRTVNTEKLQDALVDALVDKGVDYDEAYERVFESDEFAKFSEASGSFRITQSKKSEYFEDIARTRESAQAMIEMELNDRLSALGMSEDDLELEAELESELNGKPDNNDGSSPAPF